MNIKKNTRFVATITIISLLIICISSACQPTPSTQPVIGRQEDILQSVTAAAFEKLETPEHVSKEYEDFAKLNIIFDADVIVPETTAYPVTEVTKRVFSDDDILSYIELLAGNNKEIYSEWNLTKEEWAEKINEVTPYVTSKKVAQNWLNHLQENYNSAQEEVDNPIVDISDLPIGTDSEVYVQNKDNTVSEFILKRGENYFAYYRDMFLEAYPASLYEDSSFDEDFDTMEHFSWVQPGEPEISQENAYNKALEYIGKTGADLDLYSSEPCTVLVNQVEKTTGWQFTFTRAISNLQTQYNDIGLMVDPYASPSYGAPWLREICRIVIDKAGLCKLWWQGASIITNTAVESALLAPFEMAEERIVKQLSYTYGKAENGTGNGLNIKISDIELGISLISEKDKMDSGVYIPTWYISFGLKWNDEEDTKANWEQNQIMFNALDGSYIEPRVTNKDLMEMINMGLPEG